MDIENVIARAIEKAFREQEEARERRSSEDLLGVSVIISRARSGSDVILDFIRVPEVPRVGDRLSYRKKDPKNYVTDEVIEGTVMEVAWLWYKDEYVDNVYLPQIKVAY